MLWVFDVSGNHVEEEKASVVTFIEIIILRMIKFCDTPVILSLCAYTIGDLATQFCVIISVN